MMYEQIDRKQRKWEAAELLRDAQVSPKAMTALYMLLVLALNLISSLSGSGFLGIFISILTALLSAVLAAGFTLYCMAVRRGERAEFLTLFDGFSFVGKLIVLELLMGFFVMLWSLLFIIPGIIKSYEYYMVPYILAENPNISSARAFELSKMMTNGEKLNIFVLELSFLGWQLLGILACCIGNYFVTPYLEASFAELYEAMRAKVYDMGVTDENELCNFWR